MCSHDGQRRETIESTRVTWWIRDGPATLEGSDVVPGQVSKPEAEVMLDHATARVGADVHTLPKFCRSFYSCDDAEDWGIKSCEPE
jgi:hypothetical protein